MPVMYQSVLCYTCADFIVSVLFQEVTLVVSIGANRIDNISLRWCITNSSNGSSWQEVTAIRNSSYNVHQRQDFKQYKSISCKLPTLHMMRLSLSLVQRTQLQMPTSLCKAKVDFVMRAATGPVTFLLSILLMENSMSASSWVFQCIISA